MIQGRQNPSADGRPTLHLADLAPKPPTPKQSFKIMQRVPVGSSGSASSRAASAAGDSEASGSRFKTMEEREANYALARERIFKDSETIASPDSATAPASTPDEMEQRGRTLRGQPRTDEDDDFVPRRVASSLQPVYASLYHPQPDPTPPLSAYQQRQPSGQDVPGQQVYQHPDNGYNYQSNVQDMYAFGVQNGGFTSTPTQNGYTQQGHPMYTAPNQPYIDHNHQYNNANGYPPQPWQQFSPPSQPGSDSPNGTSMYAPAPPMVPGYGYPPGQMGLPGQMPMIPQGAQAFPPQYAYPQQGSPYHQLAQPTPTRPGFPPHQHSSTSSSISSRSYQDYSRPHSRGSTTSTRSATSSVRLGAMYPAQTGGSGARYRQQGMKSQPVGTSLFASSSDGQAARGHSPVRDSCAVCRIKLMSVFQYNHFVPLLETQSVHQPSTARPRPASASYTTRLGCQQCLVPPYASYAKSGADAGGARAVYAELYGAGPHDAHANDGNKSVRLPATFAQRLDCRTYASGTSKDDAEGKCMEWYGIKRGTIASKYARVQCGWSAATRRGTNNKSDGRFGSSGYTFTTGC